MTSKRPLFNWSTWIQNPALVIAAATIVIAGGVIFQTLHVATTPQSAEARQCLPGEVSCSLAPIGGSGQICEGDCTQNGLRCSGNGTLVPDPGCTAPTTLTISNVSHGTPGSDRATITWTSSIAASTEVRYGLTSSLGSRQVNAVPNSTNHSITLTGLQPSTTYHYQAYSETGPDPDDLRATSSTRTLTTASGVVGGTLPTIILGPTEYVNINTARITFKTNVPTAALIEFSTEPNTQPDPGNAGYSQVCDFPANCSSPPPQPNVLNVDHTINLTGLTQASSPYFYRITIIDANRNVFALEDRFTTTSSSSDYTFSTGDCDDGTPIRQCNAAGEYCRPGNRTPVFDCRPDINCPYTCPGGATCSESGDCVEDPALGDSSTQCNPKTCYLKCDGNSGSASGRRCGTDADCNGGKCIVGSFTIPAGSGCYASWPSCDANVILKVRPDRICDKWLTCKTSLPVTDIQGKTQNQCLDLTICDSLSPNGQCNNLLEGRQCNNDPLRFCASDSDCPGGRCRAADELPLPLTFKTPEEVSQISGLTGYAVAGLDFHLQSNSPIVPVGGGFYPLSLTQQVGSRFDIPNSNFEETVVVQRCQNDITRSCTTDQDCTPGKCIFRRESQLLVSRHWEPVKPSGSTKGGAVTLDAESSRTNPNHMLKITPTNVADSGAQTTAAVELTTVEQAGYILSLRMRSEQNDQPITVKLVNLGTRTEQVLGDLRLTTGWQPFLLGPTKGVNGPTRIAFTTPVTGEPVSFWIDDIAMLPALKVSDTKYVPQACRLYPNDSAPSCDFTDANGLQYKGLKGYCLERDPLNSAVCLSWWPVDAVSGSSLFGTDGLDGYNDRQPLYVCAEAAGNATSDNFPGDQLNGNPYATLSQYFNGFGGPILGLPVGGYTIADGDAVSCSRTEPCGGGPNTQNATKADSELRETDIARIVWRTAPREFDYESPTFAIENNVAFQRSSPGNPAVRDIQYAQNKYSIYRNVTSSGDVEWRMSSSCGGAQQAGSGAMDCIGSAYVVFDGATGFLKNYLLHAWDQTLPGNEAEFYNVEIYQRETCTKLVQVATDSSVTAWADRTSNTSTYVVPDLNYRYVNDLAPFATAAPSADDPDRWSEPLFVEGPDVSLPAPHQVRGGGAYGCVGDCSARVCAIAKVGSFCQTSSDCFDNRGTSDETDDVQGTCVGNGFCAKFDAGTKSYQLSTRPKACTTDYATSCPAGQVCCSQPDEECIGGGASDRGAQTLNSSVPTLSKPTYTQYHLMRLFAEAFSLWEWNNSTGRYERQAFTSWQPPTALCQVCSGGPNANQACITDAACGSGGTCVDAVRHPSEAVSSEPTADYCAIKPSISNISNRVCVGGPNVNQACTTDAGCGAGSTCGGQPVTIDEGATYTLRFNSNIDLEQRPLAEVSIDWGDGDVTVDGNLRIAPRDDPNKPHAYTHVFHCALQGVCAYQVKIRVKDNWGWCDNGVSDTPCQPSSGTDTSTWQDGPTVRVLR